MELSEYKKLSQKDRNQIDAVPRSMSEQKDFDAMKALFDQEVQTEIKNFEDSDKKIPEIISDVKIDNKQTVEEVKNELHVDQNLDALNQEARELKNELQIEKSVDAYTEEFVLKYDLSPIDTRKVREFFRRTATEKIHSCHFRYDEIPKEILHSPETQELVKNAIKRTLSKSSGDSIGIPHEYVETFALDPHFFADPMFDPYRKKTWQEHLSSGYEIDFASGNRKHSYLWKENDEEEKIDRLLEGNFNDVKKLFSDRELSSIVLKAIVNKINEADPKKPDDAAIVDSYSKEFKITKEKIKDAVLQYAHSNILDVSSNLEGKFPEVSAFYRSEEGKNIAKQALEEKLLSGGKIDSWFEKFNFNAKDFNTEILFEKATRLFRLPSKDSYSSRSGFFDRLKNQAEIFGDRFFDEVHDLIIESKPQDQEVFLDEAFQQVGYFWKGETENFKKLELPKNLLQDYVFEYIVSRGRQNDFYASTLDNKKEELEIFGLTPEIKSEALSIVFFREAIRGGELTQENEKYFKQKIGLDELSLTPRVLDLIKNDYLQLIKKGDTWHLKRIDTFLRREQKNIPWKPEDKAKLKEASLEGLVNVCTRGSESIDTFIKEYYPETHHVFLTMDAKVQGIISNKLINISERSLWDNSANIDKNGMNDAISYFSLDRNKIFSAFDSKIGFVEEAKVYRVKNIFPEFDALAHNNAWAEAEGEAAFHQALENKQFDQLFLFRTIPKMEILLKQEITRQEELLRNSGTSPSLRTYAGEFISAFFWSSSFTEGIATEDMELIKRLQVDTKGGFIEKIANMDLAERTAYYKEYIDNFNANVAIVASNKPLENIENEEYQLVLEEVYPKRNYDTYQYLSQYEDRSKDLDKYAFDKKGYDLKLSGVLGYQIKEGSIADERIIQDFSRRIDVIKDIANEQRMKEFLAGSTAESKATTIEGKILEYFKERGYSIDTMNVLLAYQLLGQYDNFVAESTDRVSQEESQISKNYVLLDELVNRYGDTMKETIKALQKAVMESSDKELFASSLSGKYEGKYGDLAQTIMDDLSRVPREKMKNETIQRKIIRTLKNTFQGVDVVQERVEYFATLFTVNDLDTFGEAWMRHFDELFALGSEYMLDTSKIEALQSNVYQRLQSEINKYEEVKEIDDVRGEEKMKKERTIKGHFSKNKENAHARMVGDICLAQDPTMLKNEKYFEFVLFDEDRQKCVGTTMLLEMNEVEDGKKYLLYCPNPAVGLVSEVSAKKLYKKMTDQIIQFSKENNFDAILVDKTHGKSTNRAGLFQQSLEQSCLKDSAGKEININLKNKYILGGGYAYQDNLQVVWMR